MKTHLSRKYWLCVTLLFRIVQFSEAADFSSDKENFTVKDGVIWCEEGLPQKPLWFADGRLTFSFEKPGGITRLDYYYPNEGMSHSVFSRPYHWYGFNYYLVKDGVNYLPDFQNSKIYPFGIESEWNLDGVLFQHRVMAIDETVVIQLTTPRNLLASFHLKSDFNQKFGVSAEARTWEEWKFDENENLLTGGFSEGSSVQTFRCYLGADFLIKHTKSEKNTKYYQESPVLEPGKTYTFFICVGSGSEAVSQKNQVFENNFQQKIVDQYARYQRVAKLNPKLISRWENGYYGDLVSSISKECLQFFEENLVCNAGIRETPVWDKSWDLDANQLSDWWPVTDESFIRLCNQNNRGDLLERWVGYLKYWYENLTCPESVECYFDSDDPATPDPKNPGSWQAFAMRTWYQGVIHGLVGVDADAGGITFYPYNGKEMKLTGLHYLNKTFDFEMKGSGPYIQYLEVDGEKICGTNKLPEEYYRDKDHLEVIVMRTNIEPQLFIKDGSGVAITDYSYKNGKIENNVEGAGLCRLRVYATQKPVVRLNGKTMKANYDPLLKISVMLFMQRCQELFRITSFFNWQVMLLLQWS